MKQQSNSKTALVYAVDLLSVRPYSVHQLTTKLKSKQYPPDEIATTIERLLAKHYLDDADLCVRQYQAYIREARRSLKAIRYKLLEKGFSTEDIQLAIDEADIDIIDYEYSVCLKLLRSHYKVSTADKLKCQAYLYRKAFNSSSIRMAIEDFLNV